MPQIKLGVDDRLMRRLALYRAKYGISQNAAIRVLLTDVLDEAGVPQEDDGED